MLENEGLVERRSAQTHFIIPTLHLLVLSLNEKKSEAGGSAANPKSKALMFIVNPTELVQNELKFVIKYKLWC